MSCFALVIKSHYFSIPTKSTCSHDGRVYWFNTLLFNRNDLQKLPYFDQRKLSRRATNYLLLGFSVPAILDLHAQTPLDYLRAFNALLVDFEAYQSVHSPEGNTSTSISRPRIPQMFKRPLTGAKNRRPSAVADLTHHLSGTGGVGTGGGAESDSSANSFSSFPHNADLDSASGGKDYAYLMTPSIPFEPDFYETFATLCDVLIDCYTKIMTLLSAPEMCGPGVSDTFAKADSRVRKIIVAGIVREFEDASRSGVKSEVAGVGKVVLGGLM